MAGLPPEEDKGIWGNPEVAAHPGAKRTVSITLEALAGCLEPEGRLYARFQARSVAILGISMINLQAVSNSMGARDMTFNRIRKNVERSGT